MKISSLAFKYVLHDIASSILQILTFAVGAALIFLVLNISSQLTKNFSQGEGAVDVVIGAKGSPLQLVLSTIYHSDIPTGNIKYSDYERFKRDKNLKQLVPISLGDSHKNYRIVGTNLEFFKLYKTSFLDGENWQEPMQAVVGYNVAKNLDLKIGDRFLGSHGLVQGGHVHEDESYEITGVLAKSGNAVDNLIITSLASVWDIHSHHDHEEEEHEEEHYDHHEDEEHEHHEHEDEHEHFDEDLEITAILANYKNKIYAVNFPRLINKNTNMQAASPSFEMSRLFNMLGFGFDSAKIIAYILLFIAFLGTFLTLINNVKKRKYDIAILRVVGASRVNIIKLVVFESFILNIIGLIIGVLLARFSLVFLSNIAQKAGAFSFDYEFLSTQELYVAIFLMCLSLVAGVIPAIIAFRINISELLLKKS